MFHALFKIPAAIIGTFFALLTHRDRQHCNSQQVYLYRGGMMTDNDAFADRKRAQEEEYFRRKEEEALTRMRQRTAEETERRIMADALGVADDEFLRGLQKLGYTGETVALLLFAPLVQIAWADGWINKDERDLIFEAARSSGVEEGSTVYALLADWLDNRPAEAFLEQEQNLHLREIGAMLQLLPPEEREARKQRLISSCAQIAQASGDHKGWLRLGRSDVKATQKAFGRISSELERTCTG
jgi:hypothetical protein